MPYVHVIQCNVYTTFNRNPIRDLEIKHMDGQTNILVAMEYLCYYSSLEYILIEMMTVAQLVKEF